MDNIDNEGESKPIDLQALTPKYKRVISGGNWVADSSSLSVCVPVSGGQKLHIVGNSLHNTYFAPLKSIPTDIPVSGSAADLCDGYSDRVTIIKNTEIDFEVPNDALCISVVIQSTHNDCSPTITMLSDIGKLQKLRQSILAEKDRAQNKELEITAELTKTNEKLDNNYTKHLELSEQLYGAEPKDIEISDRVNWIITEANGFTRVSTEKSVWVHIEGFNKVLINNPSDYDAFYALLKQDQSFVGYDNTNRPPLPQYCDGTEYRELNAKSSVEIDIPADCKYIFLHVVRNNNELNTTVVPAEEQNGDIPIIKARLDKLNNQSGVADVVDIPMVNGNTTINHNYTKAHISFKFQLKHLPVDGALRQLIKVGNNVFGYINDTASLIENQDIQKRMRIQLNSSIMRIFAPKYKPYCGAAVFTLRYTGVVNDANKDIVADITDSHAIIKHSTSGSVIGQVSYTPTTSIDDAIDLINGITDIECVRYESFAHTMGEVFYLGKDIPLVVDFTRTTGTTTTEAPVIKFNLEIDKSWHTCEVVADRSVLAIAVDGITMSTDTPLSYGNIELGDAIDGSHLDVVFKDIHCNFGSLEDAEIIEDYDPVGLVNHTKKIISSMNPKLLIMEGHSVTDGIRDEESTQGIDAATSRLFRIFDYMQENGYTPVTWEDVVRWKKCGGILPKRCYAVMLDDFRVSALIDSAKSLPFRRYGVYSGLAIIVPEGKTKDDKYSDNERYTIGESLDICSRNGWYCASHIRHQKLGEVNVTDVPNILSNAFDVGNECGIKTDVIVYPGGSTQDALTSVSLSPFSIGVMVDALPSPCQGASDYFLTRLSVSHSLSWDNFFKFVV